MFIDKFIRVIAYVEKSLPLSYIQDTAESPLTALVC